MKRYLTTFVLLFMTAIAGFAMPSKLLEWEDVHRINHLETQPSEKVLLTAQTNMTLIEKIQLMQNDMAATIAMADGKNYTAEGMIVQVQNELETLSELGIFELERFDLTYGVEDILFFVDIQGGTQSMLLWKIYAMTGDGIIRMIVDDETGKILTLTCTEGKGTVSVSASDYSIVVPESEESVQKSADSGQMNIIAQKWAEYLGIELVETSVTEYQDDYIYATYEDESGIVVYGFRINTGQIIFMTDIYM